jgi:hypothetical protein
MTSIKIAAVLALAPALALAAAPADPMAGFYGNTLRIELPGQDYLAYRRFAPDHTYVDEGSEGEVHGTWAIEKDRICVTAQGSTTRYCNLGLGKAPGDTWTDHDPYTFNEVVFTLTAGPRAVR